MQSIPESAEETLRQLVVQTKGSLDPIRQLALYALGDVVELGFMSQEEYDAEPEYDLDESCIRPSGREIALQMIPVRERIKCWTELASYLYAKKKPSDDGNPNDDDIVHFYLPHNKRMDEVAVKDAEFEIEPEPVEDELQEKKLKRRIRKRNKKDG